MTRVLLTFAILATTGGIAAGVTTIPGATPAPAREVQVVGRERPLFLGSAVVTATALPKTR